VFLLLVGDHTLAGIRVVDHVDTVARFEGSRVFAKDGEEPVDLCGRRGRLLDDDLGREPGADKLDRVDLVVGQRDDRRDAVGEFVGVFRGDPEQDGTGLLGGRHVVVLEQAHEVVHEWLEGAGVLLDDQFAGPRTLLAGDRFLGLERLAYLGDVSITPASPDDGSTSPTGTDVSLLIGSGIGFERDIRVDTGGGRCRQDPNQVHSFTSDHRLLHGMLDSDYDECWLRYPRVDDADRRESYATRCLHVYAGETSPQHRAVRDELREGLEGLLGREPHLWQHPPRSVDGFLVVGQPDLLEVVADSVDVEMVRSLDDDGYHLRSTTWGRRRDYGRHGADRPGLVYRTFHLLRLMAAGEPIDDLDLVEEPRNAERLINQWDEPFRGTVERGYGGESIFKWEHLPDLRERYFDYARLLASVGINGIVLNDVNTTRPERPGDLAATGEFEGPRPARRTAPPEGGRPGRGVPAVRHPDVPFGELRLADVRGRPRHGGPARRRRRGLVGGEGRSGVRPDPRLRRVPRQSRL